MKKILLFILMMFVVTTSLITNQSITKIRAEYPIIEAVGATYQVTEREKEEMLDYGINYISDFAQSSSKALIGGTNSIDPQKVNVLTVPVSSGLRIVNWSYSSSSKWTKSTVKNLAKDFEANNPGWVVLAGTNGDFFDINGKGALPYQTNGVCVNNGDVVRSVASKSSVGFTNDGTSNSLIGNKEFEVESFHTLTIYSNTKEILKEIKVDKLNKAPVDDEVAVYFSYYKKTDNQTETIKASVPSENSYISKSSIRCYGMSSSKLFARGVISDVNQEYTLEIGQFAIVTSNKSVTDLLSSGVEVRVQQNVIGDYASCDNITGAGQTLLFNGEAHDSLDNMSDYRHPRTVIGKKADGSIVMAVVDGRQQERNMYGMTYEELSAMMLNYGCVEAYNLDGGGSTTMILRNDFGSFDTVNSPSDGSERHDSNALFVVAPEITLRVNEVTDTTARFFYNRPSNEIEVNNVKVTLTDGKDTFTKSTDDFECSFDNLKSSTEYRYSYTYDLTYKGKTTSLTSKTFKIVTGKDRPTITDCYYEVMDDFIVCNFKINDIHGIIQSLTIRCGSEVALLNATKTSYIFDKSKLNEDGITIMMTYNPGAEPSSPVSEVIKIKEYVPEPEPVSPTEPAKKGCFKKASAVIALLTSTSLVIYVLKKKN